MKENYKKFILDRIYSASGIIIAPIHSLGVCAFVEKQLIKNNVSIEEYCQLLDKDPVVLNQLINQATTNETYFFREEKQFDYLKNVLFPKYKYKKLVIWSAACSTGEEPLSILALALQFNIDVKIYASDIDDNVLSFFRKGEYTKYSFRKDGEKYHQYLKKLGDFNEDKTKFKFKQEVLNKIKIVKYNLTDFSNFPIHENIDIIFMRNVFIYFDTETRAKITEEVTKRLNENGHLFYSINEIGNIHNKVVPDYMKKSNYEQIYFYIKKENEEKSLVKNKTNKELKPCDIFNQLNSALLKKDFTSAYNIADNYKPSFSDRVFSSFFKGYVLMEKKEYAEAERYFTTSEFLKGEFWPAYYFHGILLEKISSKNKASICFKKCFEKMESYMAQHNCEYDFLLRDVSPESIYSYCSSMAKEGCNGI